LPSEKKERQASMFSHLKPKRSKGFLIKLIKNSFSNLFLVFIDKISFLLKAEIPSQRPTFQKELLKTPDEN